ncbi:MAG: ABC transporter permease [Cellulosilyticaceae bacterium]
MNIIECIKGAVRQLVGNKMRTFLTMLGMFIGIGSVIMVLSIGAGVRQMMVSTFEDIGRGTVMVQTANYEVANMITGEDLEAIREMPEVEDAIMLGEIMFVSLKNYKDEDKSVICQGVPYNIDVVQSLNIVEGRMYTLQEEVAKASVAIVSETYAKAIMGVDDPAAALGEIVELNLMGETHSFEIVGVFEATTFPGMPEEMMPLNVNVPFSVMDQIMNFGDLRAYQAAFMVKDDFNPSEVAYQAGRLLDKRHNTQNSFKTQSASAMIDQMDAVMGVVTGFISFVAAISLLVGGIGIMNIMLVTVKERTREIGIRKAVGATNGEILRQFLIEAVILTLLGGIIGMILGYGGGVLVGTLFAIEVHLTIDMIIFAVGTSSVIGILFGVYPAKQAAKLDPVEALRYE